MVTVEAELSKRNAEFVRVLQAGAEPTRATDAGTAVSMARVLLTRSHVIAALRNPERLEFFQKPDKVL